MNILITGALGFTGQYIISYLRKLNKSDVIFLSDIKSDAKDKNIIYCDISNRRNARNLVSNVSPDVIFHLTGTFTNDFKIDIKANVDTSKNILNAVKELGINCRVLLIGSAAEYGFIEKHENPIKETHPLRPASIYGLSKVYQTYLMKYYCTVHQLDIVMARPFNIYGKEMSVRLFCGKLYHQIDKFKNNEIQTIKVGNLENERDYIHIEQVVQHYVNIMNNGLQGEIYNVGTGFPMKTKALLDKILREEDLDMSIIEETETGRLESYDVPQIYADVTKLKQLI